MDMVWEDVEEERELLEAVDYDTRRRHCRALQGGLLWYLVVALAFSAALFLLAWSIFGSR